MITLNNVSKTYETKDGEVHALRDVTLTIEKGDIFGIIGMSGAGKSTLVRCLNFLERPTAGAVLIDGKDLSQLAEKQLRAERRNIGMIFQHFNLLMQKNVIDNICFPMKIAGTPKAAARKRAKELLEIVGLTDKASAYPIQLSGGQKQRVAIARALATNPKILLCDEATSALDPQTTKAILALLKEINEKYGITIVIITHEMAVVREICNRVGIIGEGRLVEHGNVIDVFSHPQSQEAKELVLRTGGENPDLVETLETRNCVRIVFSENSSYEPVIANMVLRFGAPVNILKADTKNVSGIARGEMILGLPEEREIARDMIKYLRERNLAVEEVTGYVG
ncbi:MAG: ATP-binding cassette domain-containing protein [Roseburia sp.]|nr:ATP-binding cassette domain-containing protein [Roseburia sp.]